MVEGREIGDGGGGSEIGVMDAKPRLDAKTKARLERASRARTRSRQQQRAEVATREQQRQTQAGAGGASATEVEEAQPIGPVDAKPLLPPPPPLQADLEKSKTKTVARSWLACSTLECEPNDHLHPFPSWRPEGLMTASARSRRATTRPGAFERDSCCDHYQLDWVA